MRQIGFPGTLRPAVLSLLLAAACAPARPAAAPTSAPPTLPPDARSPSRPEAIDVGASGVVAATSAESARLPLAARHGMVVSAFPLASRAGDAVLRSGGNAVDAAVAVGFALAVTHPSAGNIGGGGFMVIRFPDGHATTIDFREKAPLAADSEMFVDPQTGEYSHARHHDSLLSIGVPGTVAGFDLAHSRYGSLDWKALVQPAVDLAENGFVLTPSLARSMEYGLGHMKDYPASVAKFSRNGQPYAAGETWKQPTLGRTLRRIRDEGRAGFYGGETARLIAEAMRRDGGLITEEDLARYQAEERAPIRGTYRGFEVISMPPPSSGGVAIVEMLNILEGFDLGAMGQNSPQYVHVVSEAMRRAFRDRAEFLADTDFVPVPIERLTSKAYAAKLRATIDPDRATPSKPSDITLAPESPQTTHYSVVDGSGMAVSVTYTLEQGYGSKYVVPGGGFLLNNEMGDFNARPGLTNESGLIGTEPNLARPEQRMLSSMSPSIVAKDGQLYAVVGSPGGRTIINTVLEIVLGLTDFHEDIQQAVNAKRFHHQWLPDVIHAEEGALSTADVAQLKAMGHDVRVGGEQGVADCIMRDPKTGVLYGAPDPRDEDSAAVGH